MKTLSTFSALLFVSGTLFISGCEPVETLPPVRLQSISMPGETIPIMPDETAPVLERIWPAKGSPGALVYLYGQGFSVNNDGNLIFFDGTYAPLVKVMGNNMLVVTVPVEARTGPIRIVVDGKECLGPVFTVASTD